MMILTAKVDFKKLMVILLAAAAVLLAVILLVWRQRNRLHPNLCRLCQ